MYIYVYVYVCVCVYIHTHTYICIAKVKLLSCVRLFATPWTEAYQDPPSMGFSRQEYWSGLPLPSPYICIYVCVYIYSLFQIPFPYRLLQNTEYSSLLCTAGPYLLSILGVVVCIC